MSNQVDFKRTLRFRFRDVIKPHMEVNLRSTNCEERTEAKGLKMNLDDFSLIFLTVIFSKMFSAITHISSYLQSKSTNIKQDETLIQNAYHNIRIMRNNFMELKKES